MKILKSKICYTSVVLEFLQKHVYFAVGLGEEYFK